MLYYALLIPGLPFIIHALRRTAVSLWSELVSLKADLEAVKAKPVDQPASTDLTPITDALATMSARIDALAELVGTPPA